MDIRKSSFIFFIFLFTFILISSISSSQDLNELLHSGCLTLQQKAIQDLSEDADIWEAGFFSCKPAGIVTADSVLQPWMLPLAAAVVLSLAIMIFIYFTGVIFNDPKISAWSKKETYQVIGNLIIVVFIVFLLTFFNAIIASALSSYHGLGSPPDSLQQISYYYVVSVRDSMISTYVLAGLFQAVIEGVFSAKLHMAIPFNLFGIDFSMGPMFELLLGMFGFINNLLNVALAYWFVKEPFMCFITNTMLTILLPLGVLLRNFSATRSAGGGLIALVLAFYFVFPAMIYLNALIVSDWFEVDFVRVIEYGKSAHMRPFGINIVKALIEPIDVFDWNNSPPFVYSSFFKILVGGIGFIMGAFIIAGLAGALSGAVAIAISTVGIVSTTLFVILTAIQGFLVYTVTMVFITTIILPIFNIFITLNVAKDLAKFLGSEMSFDSLLSLV
ncbi:hypothetical protein KO465_00295 [Candidatus Micrarchaeota archaeon]|nr:hypothetical protein [Candidatus Micrarchaeota archaeon]